MNMLTPKEIFMQQGYTVVKGFISKDVARLLFNYLLLHAKAAQANGGLLGDQQVPGALTALNGDLAFEALMFSVHKQMERHTGLELLPTYTYRRMYTRGNILHRHKDRPSCEISATIKLSDTGGYNWPIWMVDTPYELEDGDAVIYRGCDLEHWRDPCEGPEGYLMGQVFTHFVDKNGPYTDYVFDRNPQRAATFNAAKDDFRSLME